jgi:short-subunit dehydrogenase
VIFGSKLALERFLPRGTGHLVNIASTAGKAGVAGGATYCATKHAVVGLSEAIRQEVRGTGIGVSVVMPHVVNTELGSGLSNTRGFKLVEPEEVADAIVGALQNGRYEVFVPRAMGLLLRSKALVPTSLAEFVARTIKGDRVLVNPDHAARAAYEARMAQTVSESPRASERETPDREAQVASA